MGRLLSGVFLNNLYYFWSAVIASNAAKSVRGKRCLEKCNDTHCHHSVCKLFAVFVPNDIRDIKITLLGYLVIS